MKIIDKLKNTERSISLEFFPPKTVEGEEKLINTIQQLKAVNPAFVSITYGAGGSTRDRTIRTVLKVHKETDLTVMAHQTCIGHTQEQITQILETYKNNGIQNILALRGDIPQDLGEGDIQSGCKYASDLVELIRERFGDYFCIGVATYPEGHPESPDLDTDIKHFKEKVEKGGEFAITQMFFDNSYFYRFMEKVEKEGINIPIIPGIMPITNFEQISRFAKMCGATIPDKLAQLFAEAKDKTDMEKIGIEFAINQCIDLLKNGVKGLHFYTLNKAEPTLKIYQGIKGYL
ncbi:MAG: methylenetetrahydrofolate reductase [NAD(P)H] [Aquificae bacterium]|nr:methylenetetrahydrofolate reductase [NAD(P)H] [Aquificota bacterium]